MKRLYEAPDIALVVKKTGLQTLMKDLKSLIEVGGFYYEVFDLKHPRDKDKQVVVLFFDDSLIDLTAEMVKLQARTCEYNCRVEFKAFARQEFERFTGREV
jgi:hypothetical protein